MTDIKLDEPITEFWDLIAREVLFEQIGLATWWLVAVDSADHRTADEGTAIGVAHLDQNRHLTCKWSKEGAALIGRNETAFRRRIAGILALQMGAR
jgi:hypothetical protein